MCVSLLPVFGSRHGWDVAEKNNLCAQNRDAFYTLNFLTSSGILLAFPSRSAYGPQPRLPFPFPG